MQHLPVGTVTLLFTDIEGSTHLLEQLGERYTGVLAEYRSLLRTTFHAHDGHEVDTQGDSFFVAFARATDAVSAAVEMQRTLFAHAWPNGLKMRVRIGLHTGEPTLTDTGYVGLAVNTAARVCFAAHGGQIVLSSAARKAVEASMPAGVGFRDLGRHELQGLPAAEALPCPRFPDNPPPLRVLPGSSGRRYSSSLQNRASEGCALPSSS